MLYMAYPIAETVLIGISFIVAAVFVGFWFSAVKTQQDPARKTFRYGKIALCLVATYVLLDHPFRLSRSLSTNTRD